MIFLSKRSQNRHKNSIMQELGNLVNITRGNADNRVMNQYKFYRSIFSNHVSQVQGKFIRFVLGLKRVSYVG